ncbi:CoA-binding protein [Acidisoma cladoniae]|jgi:predicted CoA-binding protein|uniref:CoA-binding protein n=1 Tax=Acidisoma cladoniae TaxID=3040935 RepID=UPI00254F230E|nr:CoA-binding protein [Acidisoma sp. PAMC 29798]
MSDNPTIESHVATGARIDAEIRDALTRYRRVALVGASPKPERPSHGVMGFLLRHGFDVTPINPGVAGQEIHGKPVVATLDQAAPLDIVDIFRASDQVGPVVTEAIRLGAKVIWMQLGVINHAAAAEARAAGLTVIMDRCPAIEWPRLGLHRV